MKTRFAALLLATGLFAAPALADDKADVETFMANYLKLWNAHDAATISAKIYRLDPGNPWATEAGLKAEFDRLIADGYDRSDTSSIKGCILSADTAQVELRYVRLRTDGSFMPPHDRVSVYRLRRFPDGWRVTGFSGLAAGASMDCPTG